MAGKNWESGLWYTKFDTNEDLSKWSVKYCKWPVGRYSSSLLRNSILNSIFLQKNKIKTSKAKAKVPVSIQMHRESLINN